MANLSIVIPIGPLEDGLPLLLKDLEKLGPFEVIVVGTEKISLPPAKIKNLKYLICEVGRAPQLNFGAKNSAGEFIWFLHADSRINKKSYINLVDSLKKNSNDIHYFNLKFSSKKMFLNELGVKLRSDLLGMPFGDQGIAVKKEIFESVGGFKNTVGEGHHFIWQAKLKGLKLRNTHGTIYTSARKYEQNGRLRTTLRHLYLTYKQAFPYWVKILKG